VANAVVIDHAVDARLLAVARVIGLRAQCASMAPEPTLVVPRLVGPANPFRRRRALAARKRNGRPVSGTPVGPADRTARF
jgi:hypothetical protein